MRTVLIYGALAVAMPPCPSSWEAGTSDWIRAELAGTEAGRRAEAVRWSAECSWPFLPESVRGLLRDPDPAVRLEAAKAYSQARRPGDDGEALRRALAVETDREIQGVELRALVPLMGAGVAPHLADLMGQVAGSADRQDADLYEELCVVSRSLEGAGLYEVASDENFSREAREGAIWSLGCAGLPAVPQLRAALALRPPIAGIAASMLARLAEPFSGLDRATVAALGRVLKARAGAVVVSGPDRCVSDDAFYEARSLLALAAAVGTDGECGTLAMALGDACPDVRLDALAISHRCMTDVTLGARVRDLARSDRDARVREAAGALVQQRR